MTGRTDVYMGWTSSGGAAINYGDGDPRNARTIFAVDGKDDMKVWLLAILWTMKSVKEKDAVIIMNPPPDAIMKFYKLQERGCEYADLWKLIDTQRRSFPDDVKLWAFSFFGTTMKCLGSDATIHKPADDYSKMHNAQKFASLTD